MILRQQRLGVTWYLDFDPETRTIRRIWSPHYHRDKGHPKTAGEYSLIEDQQCTVTGVQVRLDDGTSEVFQVSNPKHIFDCFDCKSSEEEGASNEPST